MRVYIGYIATHKQAAATAAPSTHFAAATRWVQQLQRQSHRYMQTWFRVLDTIERREKVTGWLEEEKEREEQEGVGALVCMGSGKRVVQS